jgi:bacillopeptidase F
MKGLGSALLVLVSMVALQAPVVASSTALEVPVFLREKVAPEILDRIAADPIAPIDVIVMMEEQADLERLSAELSAEGIERKARAGRVIPVLKEMAARSQASLRSDLERKNGRVLAVRSLWMVNALLVRAMPGPLLEVALRPDVAHLFLDHAVDVDRAFVEGAPSGGAAKSAVPGQAEPGLRAVAAPQLWGRGFTGAGILVMNLDSGVDGNHPSMADRWLGNDPEVLDSDAWFDNPIEQACPTPCDYDFHGTLTLSVVTGLESATADTIGVSFGSRWIAGAVVGTTTGHVLSAMQWAVDPPGGTRPPADVMNLSIQDPSVGFAGDCGPNGTYWAAVDAFEAIGGAAVWAAGNLGPNPMTVNHPKNRLTTPVNMFTVGNISPHSPLFPIHSTSSRGPSICDALTPKPEVVAPGTSIRVATPGGGYSPFSGTSLAAPHVAGVIALLMEAFPEVTGTEIKFALLATARDLGPIGDDNAYGMGLIDAGAAYDLLASTAAVEDPGAAPSSRVFLSETSPNPARGRATLNLGLPVAARVTLRVYNLKGQVVATLLDAEVRGAGHHVVTWDGRTTEGERAASGVYFFRLDTRARVADQSQSGTWFRKAVLLD